MKWGNVMKKRILAFASVCCILTGICSCFAGASATAVAQYNEIASSTTIVSDNDVACNNGLLSFEVTQEMLDANQNTPIKVFTAVTEAVYSPTDNGSRIAASDTVTVYTRANGYFLSGDFYFEVSVYSDHPLICLFYSFFGTMRCLHNYVYADDPSFEEGSLFGRSELVASHLFSLGAKAGDTVSIYVSGEYTCNFGNDPIHNTTYFATKE